MATATQIIKTALALIGVTRPGLTDPSATLLTESLDALNALCEGWSTERLNIHSIQTNRWPLAAGTQSYTIGPTGTFNTARPVKIESASVFIDGLAKFPLEMVTAQQWEAIDDRIASADAPSKLYNDGAAPLSKLWLWPRPQFTGAQLELATWIQIASFPDLATDVSLSTGYVRALEYGLALDMGARLPMAKITEAVTAQAAQALAGLRSLNQLMMDAQPVSAPVTAVGA